MKLLQSTKSKNKSPSTFGLSSRPTSSNIDGTIRKLMYLWLKSVMNDKALTEDNFLVFLSDPMNLTKLLIFLFEKQLDTKNLSIPQSFDRKKFACLEFISKNLIIQSKSDCARPLNLTDDLPTILWVIIQNFEISHNNSYDEIKQSRMLEINWIDHFGIECQKCFKSFKKSKKENFDALYLKFFDRCVEISSQYLFGSNTEKRNLYLDLIKQSRSLTSPVPPTIQVDRNVQLFISLSATLRLILGFDPQYNNGHHIRTIKEKENSVQLVANTLKEMIMNPEKFKKTSRGHISPSEFEVNHDELEDIGDFRIADQIKMINSDDLYTSNEKILEDTSVFQMTIISLRNFVFAAKDIVEQSQDDALVEYTADCSLEARIIDLMFLKFSLRCYINIYNSLIDYENRLMDVNQNFISSLESIIGSISETGNLCFQLGSKVHCKVSNFFSIRIFAQLFNSFANEQNEIFYSSIRDPLKSFNKIIDKLISNIRQLTDQDLIDQQIAMIKNIIANLGSLKHSDYIESDLHLETKKMFENLCAKLTKNLLDIRTIQSILDYCDNCSKSVMMCLDIDNNNQFIYHRKNMLDQAAKVRKTIQILEKDADDYIKEQWDFDKYLRIVDSHVVDIDFLMCWQDATFHSKEASFVNENESHYEGNLELITFKQSNLAAIDALRMRVSSNLGEELRLHLRKLSRHLFIPSNIENLKSLNCNDYGLFINPWIVGEDLDFSKDIIDINNATQFSSDFTENGCLAISIKTFETSKTVKVPYYYVLLKCKSFSNVYSSFVAKLINLLKSNDNINIGILTGIIMNLCFEDKFNVQQSIFSLNSFFLNHYPKIEGIVSIKKLVFSMNKANVHFAALMMIQGLIELRSWSSHYRIFVDDLNKCIKKHLNTNEILYASAYSYLNLITSLKSQYINALSETIQSYNLMEYDKGELNHYITLIKHYKLSVARTFNAMSLEQLYEMEDFENRIMYNKTFALTEGSEIKFNLFESHIALFLVELKSKIDSFYSSNQKSHKSVEEIIEFAENFQFISLIKLNLCKLKIRLSDKLLNQNLDKSAKETTILEHSDSAAILELEFNTHVNLSFENPDNSVTFTKFISHIDRLFELLIYYSLNDSVDFSEIEATIINYLETIESNRIEDADPKMLEDYHEFLITAKFVLSEEILPMHCSDLPESFKKINMTTITELENCLTKNPEQISELYGENNLKYILECLVKYGKNIETFGKILQDFQDITQNDKFDIQAFDFEKKLIFKVLIVILESQNSGKDYTEAIRLFNGSVRGHSIEIQSNITEDGNESYQAGSTENEVIRIENKKADSEVKKFTMDRFLNTLSTLKSIFASNSIWTSYHPDFELSQLLSDVCNISIFFKNSTSYDLDTYDTPHEIRSMYEDTKAKINASTKFNCCILKSIINNSNSFGYLRSILSELGISGSATILQKLNFLEKHSGKHAFVFLETLYANEKDLKKNFNTFEKEFSNYDLKYLHLDQFSLLFNFLDTYKYCLSKLGTLEFENAEMASCFHLHHHAIDSNSQVIANVIICFEKIISFVRSDDNECKEEFNFAIEYIHMLKKVTECLDADYLEDQVYVAIYAHWLNVLIRDILKHNDIKLKFFKFVLENVSVFAEALSKIAELKHAELQELCNQLFRAEFLSVALQIRDQDDSYFPILEVLSDNNFELANNGSSTNQESRKTSRDFNPVLFRKNLHQFIYILMKLNPTENELHESMAKLVYSASMHESHSGVHQDSESDSGLNLNDRIISYFYALSQIEESDSSNLFDQFGNTLNHYLGSRLNRFEFMNYINRMCPEIDDANPKPKNSSCYISIQYEASLIAKFNEFLHSEEPRVIGSLNKDLKLIVLDSLKEFCNLESIVSKNLADLNKLRNDLNAVLGCFKCNTVSKFINSCENVTNICKSVEFPDHNFEMLLNASIKYRICNVIMQIVNCFEIRSLKAANIEGSRDTRLNFAIADLHVILKRLAIHCPPIFTKRLRRLIDFISALNQKKFQYDKKYLPVDHIDLYDEEYSYLRLDIIEQLKKHDLTPLCLIKILFHDSTYYCTTPIDFQQTLSFDDLQSRLVDFGILLSDEERSLLRRSVDLSGCGIIDRYSLCLALCHEDLERIYRTKEHAFIEHILAVFIQKCQCDPRVTAHSVEGYIYMICGKRFLLKMHPFYILVRVGGGWSPIEEIFAKYDKCRKHFSNV
ncbi:MAG: hypothetical protein MHMPM18_000279 [Marteilia pararefringens]